MKRILSIAILMGVFYSSMPMEYLHEIMHEHAQHDDCGVDHHTKLTQEMCKGCTHHVHIPVRSEHFHKYIPNCDFVKIASQKNRSWIFHAFQKVSFFSTTNEFSSIKVLQKTVGNSRSLTNKGPPAVV